MVVNGDAKGRINAMLYIANDALDPAYNQAFEACAFELPLREDVLLVWRNRRAVVCGRYQNLYQETHLPTAAVRGAALVRRTTGGGCVYHDPGNVNYTWITDARDGACERVLARVMDVLRQMGAPVEPLGAGGIAVAGRKVSGSARRVANGRLLHHGTLLVDADLGALRSLANGHSACYRSRAIRSVPAPVANLSAWLGGMDAATLAERLVAAFAPERIAPDLAGRAEALAQSRYRAWSWTFGESPKFVFERAFDAGGAPMCVRYAAERGEIRQIHVEGEGGARVARALNGARLALDELRARLWDAIADEARAQALLENLF